MFCEGGCWCCHTPVWNEYSSLSRMLIVLPPTEASTTGDKPEVEILQDQFNFHDGANTGGSGSVAAGLMN